jgi:phenylalanyl-tRNA synthetase alpha chain
MADVMEQIEAVSAGADADLAAVKDAAGLEQFRIKFLGAKGAVKGLMKLLGQASKEEKPVLGQKINALQDRLTSAFEGLKSSLGSGGGKDQWVDVTEPGEPSDRRIDGVIWADGILDRLGAGGGG